MIYRFFVIACLLFATVTTIESAPLKRFTVRDAANRQAVCNDGTPAVYYFRPGFGARANQWMIFLAGGGLCYSAENCAQRWAERPDLMTSNGKPATLVLQGLLSDVQSSNPDFYNMNHVVVPYCSSDLWSGNREASTTTGNFEFRGLRIVQAIVADLKNRPSGAKLSSASKVLLSGTSAGGIGVMVHLDWLAAALPNSDVRGINDAGFIPDVPYITQDLPKNYQLARQLWNGSGDATCIAANPTARQKCYLTSAYPYISHPMMVQESQYDSVILGAVGVNPPFSVVEAFAANVFAAAVRKSLGPVPAAFSPRTSTHGLLYNTGFQSLTVNNYSLQQLLGTWFFDRAGVVKVIR